MYCLIKDNEVNALYFGRETETGMIFVFECIKEPSYINEGNIMYDLYPMNTVIVGLEYYPDELNIIYKTEKFSKLKEEALFYLL